VRNALLLLSLLAASATAAGAADVPQADRPGLRIETGALAALSTGQDLGAAVSVGAELPRWLPIIGAHFGFLDAIAVNRRQALGLSVSMSPAASDNGWRVGATITKPDGGAGGALEGYVRYGIAIKF